ncbi:hypothetical protein HAX54_034214, partial [Datura stramonium]|nr:hypothetical protein [Datura stramonium]
LARRMGEEAIRIFYDSQLLVNRISGMYDVKDDRMLIMPKLHLTLKYKAVVVIYSNPTRLGSIP